MSLTFDAKKMTNEHLSTVLYHLLPNHRVVDEASNRLIEKIGSFDYGRLLGVLNENLRKHSKEEIIVAFDQDATAEAAQYRFRVLHQGTPVATNVSMEVVIGAVFKALLESNSPKSYNLDTTGEAITEDDIDYINDKVFRGNSRYKAQVSLTRLVNPVLVIYDANTNKFSAGYYTSSHAVIEQISSHTYRGATFVPFTGT